MLHRRRRHTDDDGDEIVEDGGIVKVPLYLADGGERRTCISDALAAHNRYAGHRPGFVADALRFDGRLNDASSDLIDRRGCTLEEAQRLRDEAFADLERRSANAWRRKGGDPDGDGDDNNNERDPNNLEAAMEARERARLERDQRGDNAWRRTNPNAATATERQAERWRGGR